MSKSLSENFDEIIKSLKNIDKSLVDLTKFIVNYINSKETENYREIIVSDSTGACPICGSVEVTRNELMDHTTTAKQYFYECRACKCSWANSEQIIKNLLKDIDFDD